MLNKQYYVEKAKVDRLVARKNTKADFYNGIYDRYEYPVLTREFAPVHWLMNRASVCIHAPEPLRPLSFVDHIFLDVAPDVFCRIEILCFLRFFLPCI